MDKIKVRLKVDLTKYEKGLVADSEGYTVGNYGSYSKGSDRFVTVKFPNIATLDVLWESLEIIDEDYIKKNNELKEKLYNDLKTATNVFYHTGIRGGFRCLSYEYMSDGVKCHTSDYSRKSAEDVMNILKEHGIKIEIKIDD